MSSQFTRTIFNLVTIWFDYFYFSLPNKVAVVGSPRIRKNYFLRRFGRLLAHLHCHEIAHVGQHRLEIRYRAKDTRAINESATRVLVILFMQFYPFFLLSSSSILLRRLLNESSSLLCGLFSRAMEKLFFFHAEWEIFFSSGETQYEWSLPIFSLKAAQCNTCCATRAPFEVHSQCVLFF